MEGEDGNRTAAVPHSSDGGGQSVGPQGDLQSPSKESGEKGVVAKGVMESTESKDCMTASGGVGGNTVGSGPVKDKAVSVEEGVVESQERECTPKVLTGVGEQLVDSGQPDLPAPSTSTKPIQVDASDVAGQPQSVPPLLGEAKDGREDVVGHNGAGVTLDGTTAATSSEGVNLLAPENRDPSAKSEESSTSRPDTVTEAPHKTTSSEPPAPVLVVESQSVPKDPYVESGDQSERPGSQEETNGDSVVEKKGLLEPTSGVSVGVSLDNMSAAVQESSLSESQVALPTEQKVAEVPEEKAQKDKEEKVAEVSEEKAQKDEEEEKVEEVHVEKAQKEEIEGVGCPEENKLGESGEEQGKQDGIGGEKSPEDPQEACPTAGEGLVNQAEGIPVSSNSEDVLEIKEKNASVRDADQARHDEAGEAAVLKQTKETTVEVGDDVCQAEEEGKDQGAAVAEQPPVSGATPTKDGDSAAEPEPQLSQKIPVGASTEAEGSAVISKAESATTSAALSSVTEAESGVIPLTTLSNDGVEIAGTKDGDVVNSASVASLQEVENANDQDAAEKEPSVATGDIPGSPVLSSRNVEVETSSTKKVGEIVTLIEKKAEETSKPVPIPAGKRAKSDDPKNKSSSNSRPNSQADSEASDVTGDDRSLNPASGQEVTSAEPTKEEEEGTPCADRDGSLGSEEKEPLSAQTPKPTEEEGTAVLDKGVVDGQLGVKEAAVSCEAAASSGAASSPVEVPSSDNAAASADALKSTEQKGDETAPRTAAEAPAEENIKSLSREESSEKAEEKSPTKRKKLVGRLNLHLPHLPHLVPPFMQRHSKQKSQQLQPTDGAAGGAAPAPGAVAASEEPPARVGYKRRSMSLPSKFFSFAEGLRGHNRRNSDSRIAMESPTPSSSPPHKKAAGQRSFTKIFHRRSQSEASTPRSGLFSGWKNSAFSAFNKLRSRSRSRDVSSMSEIDPAKEGSKQSNDAAERSVASSVEVNAVVPDTANKQENSRVETTASDHKSSSDGKASADTDKGLAVVEQTRLPVDEPVKPKSEPPVSTVEPESGHAS